MKLKLFKRAPLLLGRFALGYSDYVEVYKHGPCHYTLKSKSSEIHFTGWKAKEAMHHELVSRLEVCRR